MKSAAWALLVAYALELGLGGALLAWTIFAVTGVVVANRSARTNC